MYSETAALTYEFPVLQIFTGMQGNAGDRIEARRCAEECLVPVRDEDTTRIGVEAG